MIRRIGVALVGTVLCLGLALWGSCRPTGPEYGGKHLSVWLEGYDFHVKGNDYRQSLERVAAADQAVRAALGTNAIPYLLERLRKRDSKFYTYVSSNLGRKVDFDALPKPFVSYEREHGRVVQAFEALGPAVGKIAIPELIEMLQSPAGCAHPGNVLASFGAESIPALREVLNAKSDDAQHWALSSLGRMKATAEPAVPDIVKLLDSPNWQTRARATSVLVEIGKNAPVAAPALAKQLDAKSFLIREDATRGLLKFGKEASGAVPYLLAGLEAPSKKESSKWWFIVPGVPGNDRITLYAFLLCKIAPDEAEKRAVQIFTKILEREEGICYQDFTNLLAVFPNGSKVATPLLANKLNQNPAEILHVLCTIGPDAKEALPALRALANKLQNGPSSQKPAWTTHLAAALYAIAPQESLAQVEALLIDQFDHDPKHVAKITGEFDEWLEGRSTPVFLRMLDSPELRVKKYGLRAINWLGSDAAEALPKIRRFTEENPQAQPEEQELRSLALSAVQSIETYPPRKSR